MPADLSPDLSAEALVQAEALAQAEARDEQQRADAIKAEHAAQRKAAEQAALNRHRQAIQHINERERRALHEFDTRRRTWAARVIEIVKGRQHFEMQRKDIMDRHEAERMTLRRELEPLKERQGKTAQITGAADNGTT